VLFHVLTNEQDRRSAKQQRAKVLFVASSLLEKYPSTTEGHSYVTDFLAVVSVLYSWRARRAHISTPVYRKNNMCRCWSRSEVEKSAAS
jgi:hypothetical protein